MRKALRFCLLILWSLAGSAFLLFVLLELVPGAIAPVGLEKVRYFALRSRYRPDPTLVFVPRRPDYTMHSRTRGDLADPRLDIEVPWREVHSTYVDGFRKNGGPPPYDILLIGDSFLVTGQTDDDTLSEHLRTASGRATFNMGRGWYGPPQYVELLREHGSRLRPEVVLFCFFDGNDMKDLEQYDLWRQGGSYYDFGAIEAPFFRRLGVALRDTGRTALQALRYLRPRRSSSDASLREQSGVREVRVGDRTVTMRFGYHPDSPAGRALRGEPAWSRMRRLLTEFQSLAGRTGTTPVLLFIPSKDSVYGEQSQPWAGSSEEMLRKIADDLGMIFIDLLPPFRESAARGELLYHPFDSHWNSAGRRLAAILIAERLPPPE